MGKYILFCFFSIFFTNNYAQQGNFFETYSSSLEVRFFDAIPTRDGGYAMCGSDAGFNGGDFIVIKTDSIGHINWTYRNNEFDGLDFDNAAYKLVETEDSSIIIAGGLRDINGFTDMFYAKFSKSGSQVWRKNNPFSNFHMGPDALTYENDSTLILIGRVGGGKYFFKFNTNGDTLRTKRIPFQNNEIYSVNKTIKLRGYYYMCGNSSISLQHITKIDTLGNLIWSKTTADTLGSHFYDVRILNDSTLMSLNFFSGASISDFDKI